MIFLLLCVALRRHPKMQDDEILEVADKSQKYLEGWQVS